MKQFLALVIIALASLNAAEARSIKHRIEQAHLDRIEFMDVAIAGDEDYYAGEIFVDHTAGKVTLALFAKWSCPEGMLCAAVMPEAREINLKLVKTSKDICGNRVFVVREDKRPVDGNLEEITVVDHSDDRCYYLRPVRTTEVEYRRVTAGFGAPSETFEARLSGDEALQVK